MKQIRVNVSTKVNASKIRRETKSGSEYIILPSATLPDNVVMNGIKYPADEIETSYQSLNGALAPVEHPMVDGNYVSATNSEAIMNYFVGADNRNVTRSNGRVYLEKWVNVQEANKSDKGKRLLDAIRSMEKTGEPIHTSTGIFMNVEETMETEVNAAGMEYSGIARNMIFDHDAILLDNVGAATPSQGVGIGVNNQGKQIESFNVNLDLDMSDSAEKVRERAVEAVKERYGSSYDYLWLENINDETAVFTGEQDGKYKSFAIDYKDNGQTVELIGEPQAVKSKLTYEAVMNSLSGIVNKLLSRQKLDTEKQPPHNDVEQINFNQNEGDAMRETLLKALADKNIEVNADISDADLLLKYNESLQDSEKLDAVVNTVASLADSVESIQSTLQANADAEEAKTLEANKAFAEKHGLELADVETMSVNAKAKLDENLGGTFGLNSHYQNNSTDKDEMSLSMPD